jgi:hypothetical protein
LLSRGKEPEEQFRSKGRAWTGRTARSGFAGIQISISQNGGQESLPAGSSKRSTHRAEKSANKQGTE